MLELFNQALFGVTVAIALITVVMGYLTYSISEDIDSLKLEIGDEL